MLKKSKARHSGFRNVYPKTQNELQNLPGGKWD
jgi:hypothetical protein